MKKNKKIRNLKDQEWADAAAWLSGEETSNDEAARILLSEDGEIMKKWNDLKNEDTDKIDVDKAWDKLNRQIETVSPVTPVRRLSFMHALIRIAAMVIIVAGLGWLLFEVAAPGKVSVLSSSDERNIEVPLPDGSKVYLNRNSQLIYPEKFGSNSRKVTLKGEAFFEISHEASRPFIIDAGNARVSVLGTSFNVITDNGNNEVEVYVSAGKVMLTSNDGSRNLTLEPGYIGRLSENNTSRVLNTNVNYMSWNTDRLVYDGEKLGVVFSDLKHAYNLNIVASDPAINDYRLTSQFERQPGDTIIKVICTTFNLHSVREGDIYYLLPVQNQ
jgi:transmembrane sensor